MTTRSVTRAKAPCPSALRITSTPSAAHHIGTPRGVPSGEIGSPRYCRFLSRNVGCTFRKVYRGYRSRVEQDASDHASSAPRCARPAGILFYSGGRKSLRASQRLRADSSALASGAGLARSNQRGMRNSRRNRVLIPETRRFSAVALIALLIAVFPANVQMAQHPQLYRDIAAAPVLYARLPLQLVLIAWVWWTCLSPTSSRNGVS